jgi:predicted XRE-type DNA-binding protein
LTDNDIVIDVAGRQWEVEFHPECGRWANRLSQDDAEALLAAVRVLRDHGPNLGRPLVDTVKASRHPNMKELRPGSTGRTEVRVLFAFDRKRAAILLLGGDSVARRRQERRLVRLVHEEHPDWRRTIRETPTSPRRNNKPTAKEETMSMKAWEKKVLAKPGAAARVAEIEDELRLAAGLVALREQAGLSQRDLAKRLGVSQPRVAAIERSKNVTVDLLDQYVAAVGGRLQLTVVKGNKKIELASSGSPASPKSAPGSAKRAPAKKARRPSPAKRVRKSA